MHAFRVLKLLSEDPANYPDAPREGIRRILEDVSGIPHPRDKQLDTSRIASIRMGTTVATNALLERKGERTALVVTKGFPDLLHIGNQSRPNIFDLEIKVPDQLYEMVVEVDEEVILPLGDEPTQRNGKEAASNSKYVHAALEATSYMQHGVLLLACKCSALHECMGPFTTAHHHAACGHAE